MCDFTEMTPYIAELRAAQTANPSPANVSIASREVSQEMKSVEVETKEQKIAKLRFDPAGGIIYGIKGRPLCRFDRDGYVVIRCNGVYLGSAHRLIWESVHGPIPDGLQINHINGVKTDNRICNLELVTCKQNIEHSIRTGLRNQKVKRSRLPAPAGVVGDSNLEQAT